MIRWMFHFEQGHVQSENVEEQEDKRIAERILENGGLLYLTGQNSDLFINLNCVKLIVREVVEEKSKVITAEEIQIPAEQLDVIPVQASSEQVA